MLLGEVRFQDVLRTICVTLLRINRSTGHVRYHGVSSTEGVLCIAQRVIFGCRLGEPNVPSVTAKVARLERFGNVFLYNNRSTSGIDEP